MSQKATRRPKPGTSGLTVAALFMLSAACSADGTRASRSTQTAAGGSSATAGGVAVSQAGSTSAASGMAGTSGSLPSAAGRGGNGGAAGSREPTLAAGGGGTNAAAGRGSALNAGAGGAGQMAAAGRAGGAAVGGGAAGAAGAIAPNSKLLVPAQGALLGNYYGDGTVAASDARIGRKPAIHLVYYAWDDDWPSQTARDFADGKIPLVNWEPDGIDFKNIVSGSLDSTIKARASGSKAVGKPFFLDFAAEMNGDEAWSGNDAALYVSAYRHIHDLFVAAGATNVVWAWCPNVTDVDGGNKHTLDYYPGDDYVDWTGVDGYNWGAGSGFQWQSFHDVFARIYPILAAKGKPILIGEMASDENGGDKAAWIDAMIPTLRSDYPLIKGLVWFDVHKERNWQINSSPATLAAYMRFAADPYMNP
jgi:hypothetical protein